MRIGDVFARRTDGLSLLAMRALVDRVRVTDDNRGRAAARPRVTIPAVFVWLAAVLLGAATFVVASSVALAHAAPTWLAAALAAIVTLLPLAWHLSAERGHRPRTGGARRYAARLFAVTLVVFSALFTFTDVRGATRQHGLWWLPRAEPPPPSATPVSPPTVEPAGSAAPAGIVARTNPPELDHADGAPLNLLPISRDPTINGAPILPTDLSQNARVGRLNVPRTDTACLLDVVGGRTVFIRDENNNNDLRDDPRRPLARREGGLELVIPGESPLRIRLREPLAFVQHRIVRHGELALGDERLAFALVGSDGEYSYSFHRVAIDLDRDGALAIGPDDGPEVFYVSEKTVNIADRSYTFTVDPAGDSLTLTPLDRRLPDRPTLLTGSIAPAFTARDLSGGSVQFPRGRPALLDLWSDTCHYCKESVPELTALAAEHPGLDIYIVSSGDADSARPLLPASMPTNTNIIKLADARAVHDLYRAHAVPRYYLVDARGELLCSNCGLGHIRDILPRALADG